MNTIHSALNVDASPSFEAFQKALQQGDSLLIEGLWSSPKALIALEVLRQTGKHLLFITGGEREDRLLENLETLDPGTALEFPAWETLPGEEIAPSPDIIGKRFDLLKTLLESQKPQILLCSISALLQKVLLPTSLHFETWQKGAQLSFQDLPSFLSQRGYRRVPLVSDKGEFAMRGGILDLFPVNSSDPYRIEFWGDQIEEIRLFDPVGQKTIGRTDRFSLCPAQELSSNLSEGQLGSICDYLGEFVVMWDDLLQIEDAWVAFQAMAGSKSAFFYSLTECIDTLFPSQQLICTANAIEELCPNVEILSEKSRYFQKLSFDSLGHRFSAHRYFHAICSVSDYLSFEQGPSSIFEELKLISPQTQLLFLNANETEEEQIQKEIGNRNLSLPAATSFEKGYLTAGFAVADIPLLVLPNIELTGRSRVRRQKWRNTNYHASSSEFSALSPGDTVVHFHSGIGRYLGMETQANHLGVSSEFLVLEYAEQSKLFVPLSQSYLISRYVGNREGDMPTLTQLGSKRWQTTKLQAQQQIVGYAHELLELYAKRTLHGGFRYGVDSKLVEQFEKDFPYTETGDQLTAMAAIKQDMESDRPMDRLICGDVGYGKTEVAMRTAFKAVADGGKQVALLVPTTVLAMQHFDTFSSRMNGFPIRIGILSRFQTPKQNRQTLEQVQAGHIDILIGTHRILSSDVLFKNLGLLIIDEEQRFGVKAKEHLKHLKVGIDCLTLSATPIPRTLYLSLVQARDMSIISTPPQDRLPVKTVIAESDPALIQNALLREVARGGQAFYIHNRVETITHRAHAIQKLVPQVRLRVVHGQMDSEEIDLIFHGFKQGEFELLFATTIVENGIDVPNANTIFIDRADTYGLGDLYQLRGRVGRWNRTAYAYFLTPKRGNLTEVAHKRLHALAEAGGYGGGMKLAMRDLEMRGAGNILGIQQSGQVSAIGFYLYCKLLKQAMEALKKKAPISFNEIKFESPFDARVPESYVSEPSLRMELYYRIGELSSLEKAKELFEEIADRFGSLPLSARWLYHLTRLRILCSFNHFSQIKFQNLSFYAEQQIGKQTVKKTVLLPKTIQNPERLEEYVIKELKTHFKWKEFIE